jgi:SAM-dependent methyltransferase
MILLYLALTALLILFCLAFVLLFLSQILATFTADAPFVPIPKGIEDEIIRNLDLKNGSVVYDLGCGDGRILARIAEKYPEIKAVGVEIAFWPYVLAKWKTRKYKNIKIRRENIFKTDISSATHIFLYLYPQVINRLIANIKSQCRPGTIILSCDFELEGSAPENIIDTSEKDAFTLRGKKLFVYRM